MLAYPLLRLTMHTCTQWSMSTSHNDVEETAAKTGGRQAGIVRREQKRRGRRALKTGIERDSHRDLKIVAPSSSVRSNRKRKRDDLENVSPFSKSRMVEMKEFCNLSTTHLGTQPFSPYLPVFLSPSLPPPFTVSPSPYSINDDGDIRETSASFLASSPVLQFRSPSSRDNSFGASLLRRSRRLAQRKGQGSASGCLSQAVSFISPVRNVFEYHCDNLSKHIHYIVCGNNNPVKQVRTLYIHVH